MLRGGWFLTVTAFYDVTHFENIYNGFKEYFCIKYEASALNILFVKADLFFDTYLISAVYLCKSGQPRSYLINSA